MGKRNKTMNSIQYSQHRADGKYVNAMTKYGTMRDSDSAYRFTPEPMVSDSILTTYYEQNGLFRKIINIPAEKAVKDGLNLDSLDGETVGYIEDKLDRLDWECKAAEALKWSRLYGGAIIVMLVDDGGTLETPLNINNVKRIEELRVYERAVVQPDYTSMYTGGFEPEYYNVNSIYGHFKVHKSRCLIFKNDKMPEVASNDQYRHWGVPEFTRIRNELRRTGTSHESANKLLDRSVQAVHKMKDLNSLLATEEGEEMLLKRLEAVDLARNILNTMAIDAEGEDYAFATFSMSGVKDTVEVSCNMLSAITNIPQTVLFGRSPSGMNSTGESDLENYYNFIEQIQKVALKGNLRTLLDIIFREALNTGEIKELPKYKIKFNPLWSLSEKEKAEVENTKAQAAKTRAETACLYIDAQVLDVEEVRKSLSKTGDFIVEDVLDFEENDGDFNSIMQDEHPEAKEILTRECVEEHNGKDILLRNDADYDPSAASAVIVVKDGTILVANRNDTGEICGPGGHIEHGETPLQAAVRETQEEFNITPTKLRPLFKMDDLEEDYDYPVNVYLCQEFKGTPKTDEVEMTGCRWMDVEQLLTSPNLFMPFQKSLIKFISMLSNGE